MNNVEESVQTSKLNVPKKERWDVAGGKGP